MINNLNIKRGGKEKLTEIGVSAEGESRFKMEDALADTASGQNVRTGPKWLIVEFDDELTGGMIDIKTVFKTALVGNSGKVLPSGFEEYMNTNEVDKKTFALMFGNPILMSMLNGYVRAVMGGNDTGYNELPVFNAQGQVITYTEEQENEPANDHYYNPPIPETPEETE